MNIKSLLDVKASPKLAAFFLVFILFIGCAIAYVLGTPEIKNLILFLGSSFIVMTYYYIEAWMKIEDRPDLIDYLVFNNPIETYGAIKRLLLLCFGAGVMGHMDGMTIEMIMSAGAGVGYAAFARGQ